MPSKHMPSEGLWLWGHNDPTQYRAPVVGDIPIVTDRKITVGIVFGGIAEAQANARLIAASPDLLEAAKRIYEQLYGDPMTWADQIKWQDAAEALKAAITRAEGE